MRRVRASATFVARSLELLEIRTPAPTVQARCALAEHGNRRSQHLTVLVVTKV